MRLLSRCKTSLRLFEIGAAKLVPFAMSDPGSFTLSYMTQFSEVPFSYLFILFLMSASDSLSERAV